MALAMRCVWACRSLACFLILPFEQGPRPQNGKARTFRNGYALEQLEQSGQAPGTTAGAHHLGRMHLTFARGHGFRHSAKRSARRKVAAVGKKGLRREDRHYSNWTSFG